MFPAEIKVIGTVSLSVFQQNSKFRTCRGTSSLVLIVLALRVSPLGNHRSINQSSIASNLLSSVVLRSLYNTREEQIRMEQAGFSACRECIDQPFILPQLLEHRFTFHRPAIIMFLDIRTAFDSAARSAL